MTENGNGRGNWASTAGFVLAAAGSAVGLGNLWRFPYITGENGGGLFVVIYLACIALVGLPILLAEVVIGRAAQRSPVGAFKRLAAPRSPWTGLGWLGIVAASGILSVYAVVAGWALHYTFLAVSGGLSKLGPEEVESLFGAVYSNAGLNLFWTLVFMALTVGVVSAGVHRGIERWSRMLMPMLLGMLLLLFIKALTLDGFGPAVDFVFGFHTDRLTPAGVLEALGHSFFTLGVGVGIMVTYGSYLRRDANIVTDALAVTFLDTLVALLACLVLFPITFTYGMEPSEGPGLVFTNLPMAFVQMPAGNLLAGVFFGLLFLAALTSAISMLELPTAYLVDERGWSRRRATLIAGGVISLMAIPAALSGATSLFGQNLEALFGSNWFDLVLDTVSNWMMPVGGLGFALFAGWRLTEVTRRAQFPPGMIWVFYRGWLVVLRFVVPVAVAAVFLQAVGVL